MPVDSLTRRYAGALYSQAVEEGVEEAVHSSLVAASSAIAAEPELGVLLNHPAIPDDAKIDALLAVGGTDADLYRRFIELVLRRARAQVLRHCAEAFQGFWDEGRGITRARVASALPLTDQQRVSLTEALCRLTAGVVQIDAATAPELVGGVTVRIGDTLLDGSLRTRLRKVAEALKNHQPGVSGEPVH